MRDTTFHPACMAVALFGVLSGALGCGAQGTYSRNGDNGSGLAPVGASIGSGGSGESGSGGEPTIGSGGFGDIPIAGDTGGSGMGSGGGSGLGTGGSGTGGVATGGSGSGGSATGATGMSATGGGLVPIGGMGTGGRASGGTGTMATGGAGTGGKATGGAGTGGAATGGAGTGGAATGGAGTGGAATGGAGPWILSIDFVGAANGGAGALVPLPAMAGTETAGFKPATHWNSATGLNGTVSALVSSDGTITAAALTWSSPFLSGTTGIWHIGFADAPGDVRMMNGYLDPSNAAMPGTVVVSGLAASVATSGYDVYVYTLGDIANNPTRTYKYTIGATSFMVSQSGATPTTFGGYKLASPTVAGNYVVFKNVTGTSFTLTATPVGGTQMRAPVNGIQIVSPTGS